MIDNHQASSKNGVRKVTLIASMLFGLAACGIGTDTPGASTSATMPPVNEEARALLPDDLVDSGTLRMTADFAYAPFTYLDEDGEYTGSDYELGNRIAASLGLTPEWTTQSFPTLVPSVQNGRVDAVLESININPERLKAVSFVGYINTFDVLLVPKGNPSKLDPANICGASMAIVTGGASNDLLEAYSEACVDDGKPAITFTEYGATDAQLLAVQSGRVDGTPLGSAAALVQEEASGGSVESLGPITLLDSEELLRSATAGVVISKDRPDLGVAIQMVLQDMQEDGSFLDLIESYGFDESALVPAEFVE